MNWERNTFRPFLDRLYRVGNSGLMNKNNQGEAGDRYANVNNTRELVEPSKNRI